MILKNPSLPIAIRSYVYNYRLKTDKEKRSEKWEDTKDSIKDGVEKTITIITAPIWFPLYIYGFRWQNRLIKITLFSIAPTHLLVLFFISRFFTFYIFK